MTDTTNPPPLPSTGPVSRPRAVVQDDFRDSRHWDHVDARADDVVITTCYKSGTTLVQQIVNVLLNGARDFTAMKHISPWVDSALHSPGPAAIEQLRSPRFLKSHLPFDALPYHPQWRYIYLARDGRDVCMSLFEHCKDLERAGLRDPSGRRIDHGPADFPSFWDAWVETGHPRWDWFEHIAGWWKVRDRPNVVLMHYDDIIGDKPTVVRKIAAFLGLPGDETTVQLVCRQSSIDHMKTLERAGRFGASHVKQEARFINKGTNGRWRDLLTKGQVERYFTRLREQLEPDCAAWVCAGSPVSEKRDRT